MDAELGGRERCQSCLEPVVRIRMKALFIKLPQVLYEAGYIQKGGEINSAKWMFRATRIC